MMLDEWTSTYSFDISEVYKKYKEMVHQEVRQAALTLESSSRRVSTDVGGRLVL